MRVLMLILLFAATAAQANAPAAPASTPGAPPPPASVWRPLEQGAVEHLQSGLKCPPKFGAFERTQVEMFDNYGLDVGCNYSTETAVVTVYLTRRGSGDLAAAMDEAKKEFLKTRADQHPKPVSEDRLSLNGLGWDKALYVDDGNQGDEIWVADLHGWTYEYRVTYPAAEAAATKSVLSQIMAVSEASAGVRLAACAKSPPPQRNGPRILDKARLESAPMMTSILAGAAAAAAKDQGAGAGKPITFCVDQTAQRDGHGFLIWRGVDDDGADLQADRISVMTTGAPPIMDLSAEQLATLVRKPSSAGDTVDWIATMSNGDRVSIYGYFNGRPDTDAAVALFDEILSGKAKSIGGYSADGKTITISMPQT